MNFASLGVSEPLLRALSEEGYANPTPIQTQAIPAILQGRDVLGLAQTGTGKTAAFGLPLLQRLAEKRTPLQPRLVRALILAPTRELAIQISDSLKTYGRHLKLRHAVVLGGVNQGRQIDALKGGVDILVATPGRLLDLVNQRHVKLDQVRELVIDEADRMFDMGFIRDVRRLVAALPRERHSLLFSATMPKEVAHLVAEILHDPVRIEIAPQQVAAEKIDQRVYHVAANEKRGLLRDLLRDDAMSRVIVFTRTKHGANKVAEVLARSNVSADAIHGNKSQNARQRALDAFKSGQVRVLVATDIAARGIDVDGISHVVNFELPNVAESYVHRIGRTARAGAGGIAIAFCDPSERPLLKDIERLVRAPLTVVGHAPLPAEAPHAEQPKRVLDYANRKKPNNRRRFRGNKQRKAA